MAGFLNAREQFHDTKSLSIFRIEEPTTANVIARVRKWMDKEKPDVLLSTVDHRRLLSDAGYRPEDIPVAVTSVPDGGADSGMDHASRGDRPGWHAAAELSDQ